MDVTLPIRSIVVDRGLTDGDGVDTADGALGEVQLKLLKLSLDILPRRRAETTEVGDWFSVVTDCPMTVVIVFEHLAANDRIAAVTFAIVLGVILLL